MYNTLIASMILWHGTGGKVAILFPMWCMIMSHALLASNTRLRTGSTEYDVAVVAVEERGLGAVLDLKLRI